MMSLVGRSQIPGKTYVTLVGLLTTIPFIFYPIDITNFRPSGADRWQIYGHGTKGTLGTVPHKYWARYGTSINGCPNLIQAREADHSRQRKIFTPAFSDRALKQQEPLFLKYIDQLVSKLKTGIEQDPETKFDMVKMYNFTTFDVMGDLTFGEALHMLDNAE
jgi:hypothetical protein